jgi:hypothetical protein
MTDSWQEMERRRIALAQLDGRPIRGVSWTCCHAAHEALDMRKHHLPKPSQMFSLRPQVKRPRIGAIP